MDINKNKRTILFGPNGFGKSRKSNELFDILKRDNIKTEIYTAKRIDELVNVNRKTILIGDSSTNRMQNIDIENKYKQKLNEYVTNYARTHYDSTNATQLNRASYYFSSKQLTNFLNSYIYFKNIYMKNQKKLKLKLSFEDIINLDKEFYDVKVTIPDINNLDDKAFNISEDKAVYSEEDYNLIQKILLFVETRDIAYCPVCGTTFKDNKDLVAHINEEFNTVININHSKIIEEIILEWDKVEKRHNANSPYWKIFTKPNYSDPKNILDNLVIYLNYFLNFNEIYLQAFIDKFESENIIDINEFKKDIILFNDNLNKIDKEEREITSNTSYMKKIIDEFNNIVSLPDDIKLEESKSLELKVRVDNNIENPLDILSESELKRLSLAVLHVTILERNSEYVILDDPIDSYDDFYKKKATEYIYNNVLKLVNNWFVTSHKFEFIQQLCEFFKNDALDVDVYYWYYDPNYINLNHKTENPTKKISKIGLKDFNIFVNDEMLLLRNIINNKNNSSEYNIDKTFAYLSMICILRTFKNELVNGYSGILNVLDRNKKIQKKLNYIENSYIHFSIDREVTAIHLEYILNKWIISNGNIDIKNNQKNIPLNKLRENYLVEDFDNIRGTNIVLKDVLFKILWLIYCKYKLDEKLFLFCKNELNWDIKQLRKMLYVRTYSKKIRYVRDSLSTYNNKIDEIEGVYIKHRALLNDYSHSASRLFPPYMVTSIKDISNFYEDINNIS